MRSLLLIAAILFTIVSSAQHKAWFIENKGQWDSKVTFQLPLVNGNLFLTNEGFTLVQHNATDISLLEHGRQSEAARVLRSHAVAVQFLNSKTPVVTAEEVSSSYNNYIIGNDASKWAAHCTMAGAVLYKDLYPGIDIRFYTNANGPKYDLIVHPGADLSAVSLKYTGATALSLNENQLTISTTTGNLVENIPYSYTEHDGTRQEVVCNYILSGNTIRFAAGNYDQSKTLVIDPQLVFSTFTGSSADNWGYTTTYGADGSFYAAGIALGSGFPVNAGAYQTTFQGGVTENGLPGFDMAIIKFNASGTSRVYATYIGGTGNESPMSMIENALGELVIAGRTNSANYPSSSNIGPCGEYDICITKLSADGSTVVNSRKIGGTGVDGINIRSAETPGGALSINRNYGDDIRTDIAIDPLGNIVFAGCTKSANFPTTATAFQQVSAGLQEGVILKLDPTLSTLLFSSYIGGSGDDGAFAVAINSINNNIYVGGSTSSTNFPGDKTSVVQGTYNGGITEGFIAIVDAAGTSILKSTYIGTTGNDMLYGLKLDRNNIPYIAGTTTGTFPVINATFSQAGGKQFIAKLQPDLSAYTYATVFGKGNAAPDISISGFQVDDCENIYITGWGGDANTTLGFPNSTTQGLTVTASALRSSTDGNDLYFFVMEKNAASQLYGSFFGQLNGNFSDHVHGMNRIDRYGVLYQGVCAACGGGGSPFPTTPGVWSPASGNPTNCNMAAVKIAFDFCQAPLPVTLNFFTAACAASVVSLKWSTATEQNMHQFSIEKSVNGNAWENIASLPATNNFNGSQYQYNDAATGNALYRLKMIDKDGSHRYSNVVKTNCSNRKLNIYPVPATSECKVIVEYNNIQRIKMVVLDMMGKEVLVQQHTTHAGMNSFAMNIAALSAGRYIVKITGIDNVQYGNLVIQ